MYRKSLTYDTTLL